MKYFLLKNQNDIIALKREIKNKRLKWDSPYSTSYIKIIGKAGYIIGINDYKEVSDYGNFDLLPEVELHRFLHNKLRI